MIQSFAEIRAALAAQQQQQQTTPQDAQEVPNDTGKHKNVPLTAEQVERLEQAKNAILNNCPDLTITRAWAWLWATGNTRTHKGELLRQGWIWASQKAAWYYHLPEHKTKRKGGRIPLQKIFDKYANHENESHVHN
jgi:hypothetical protein